MSETHVITTAKGSASVTIEETAEAIVLIIAGECEMRGADFIQWFEGFIPKYLDDPRPLVVYHARSGAVLTWTEDGSPEVSRYRG